MKQLCIMLIGTTLMCAAGCASIPAEWRDLRHVYEQAKDRLDPQPQDTPWSADGCVLVPQEPATGWSAEFRNIDMRRDPRSMAAERMWLAIQTGRRITDVYFMVGVDGEVDRDGKALKKRDCIRRRGLIKDELLRPIPKGVFTARFVVEGGKLNTYINGVLTGKSPSYNGQITRVAFSPHDKRRAGVEMRNARFE